MADWHRIEQRVVCIESFAGSNTLDEALPEVGRVYTIRGIRIETNTFFLLEEIRNPVHLYLEGKREVAFDSIAFRPVVEFKNDISELQAVLDRVNKREPVDA
jgi:hypothetical protein